MTLSFSLTAVVDRHISQLVGLQATWATTRGKSLCTMMAHTTAIAILPIREVHRSQEIYIISMSRLLLHAQDGVTGKRGIN